MLLNPRFWKHHHLPTTNMKFNSAQFSHSVISDSLRPHELQHARPPVHHQLPKIELITMPKDTVYLQLKLRKSTEPQTPALTHCQVWQTSLPCIMGPRMQNIWCDRFKIRVTYSSFSIKSNLY